MCFSDGPQPKAVDTLSSDKHKPDWTGARGWRAQKLMVSPEALKGKDTSVGLGPAPL